MPRRIRTRVREQPYYEIKVRFTPDQMDWIRAEAERVGDSLAGLIRQFVQHRIDHDK